MKKIFDGFTSIRHKIMVICTMLICFLAMGIAMSSVAVYIKSYYTRFESYVTDITEQTTKNIEDNIEDMDDLSRDILINSVIQSSLCAVNEKSLSQYELRKMHKQVEKELAADALYNPNIVSCSVISDNDVTFTVKKVIGKEIQKAYSKREIYEANGTAIWGLVDHNDICISRAILNLKTMKPIGYVNIVLKSEYFGEIIADTSTSFTSGSYVVDKEGMIICSNNQTYIGQKFPIDKSLIGNTGITYYNVFDLEKAYYYKGELMRNEWQMITTIPVNQYYRDIYRFAGMTAIICLFAISVAFAISILLSQRITEPTKHLLESMKIFGKGNFSHRIVITSKDEIGQISQQYNSMADNIEELVEKILSMEISQKQAEIEFLKMQINPHFLYNALDTISWMGIMGGNDEVSEMAIALGKLLRATIKRDSFVSVKQELENVKDYLFIQGYRFGDKIQVSYEIDEIVQSYVLPNFILQPLVENAIIHGLEPKIGTGHLLIRIQMDSKTLKFYISDDGIGMTDEEVQILYEQCKMEKSKYSIGIKNVYRRLQLYYGNSCDFQIESQKGQGMTVSFQIPLERVHMQKF